MSGSSRGGGETPHMKGVGMLVGNFELNPRGDLSGRGPIFFCPLKETTLQVIFLYFFACNPKRDLHC